MNILGTIKKNGFSTHKLAKEMNIKQSSIMSVVKDGANPTVNTLRNMAKALKIPVWEFFADEMTIEEVQALLEAMKQNEPKPEEVEQKPEEEKKEQVEQETKAEAPAQQEKKADELPFKDEPVQQPSLTADVALICPHCHEAIKLGFIR